MEQLAEVLGAPIIKTLTGKMVVPDDSPYTTGGLGLLGTRPSEELVEDIDTLVMLGTNFPYTKHLPEPGKVTVVQVEIDPTRAGVRMPTDVPLIGDVGATLAALLPLLNRAHDRKHLEKYQEKMRRLAGADGDTAQAGPGTDRPAVPGRLLDELATDDAILTCDSGTIATWAARHWTIRGGREFYLSGNLATMAPGAALRDRDAARLPGSAGHRVSSVTAASRC